MNLLLFLPGLLFLLFTTLGALSTLLHLLTIFLIQLLLAAPFLTLTSTSLSASLIIYFRTAFNFSREFLWEWTVNWRWVGEEAFVNQRFSGALLIGNVVALVLLGLKWSEREGGALRLLTQGLKDPRVGPLAARGEPSADCELSYPSCCWGPGPRNLGALVSDR